LRRPWDNHPPWAHWGFFITWGVAGTLGPIALLENVMNGSTAAGWWVAIALICVWLASMAVDWLAVRWLRVHVDGWTPWQPPKRKWLKS
jgi:uncharacterized membrane protein